MQRSHNAIALLLTLMFIIVISVALGYGLKMLKNSSAVVEEERLMYQSTLVLEDVLNILKNSKDMKLLKDENATEALNLFLSQSAYIPLEVDNFKVLISFSSARGRFNVNQLYNNEGEITAFNNYLQRYMVDPQYTDVLLDVMRKVTPQNRYESYNSRIFDVEPELFRGYIASREHLQKINDFYKVEYNNNNLKNIDFENLLFYYHSSENNNTKSKIDVNYATPEVWELILGVEPLRAEELSLGGGSYTSVDDLGLSPDEKANFEKFETSFCERYLLVKMNIMSDIGESEIVFEYDIKNEKGYGFVFKI